MLILKMMMREKNFQTQEYVLKKILIDYRYKSNIIFTVHTVVNLCSCLKHLKNLLHLNVAACLLKMGESRKSIESCNKVTLQTLCWKFSALWKRENLLFGIIP